MTGFGKASATLPGRKLTVEVKSLNSKTADVATRLPARLREADMEVRREVAARLQRGKIDVSVTLESVADGAGDAASEGPRLDIGALQAFKAELEQLGARLGLPEPADWYETLLRYPAAYVEADGDGGEVPEPMLEALRTALDNALEAVTAFRAVEGAKLETFFGERISAITALLGQVEPYEQERVPRIRQRLEEALDALNRPGIDRTRLEQEMIFYIEKFDVTEEKQRLRAHLHYFMETMAGAPGQGKKLGFIAQEMGREINTLGSKSNHAEMQRIVVKMKDELEQIKEQVLNVL